MDVLGKSGMSKPVSSGAGLVPNGAPPVSPAPAAPGLAPPAMFNPGAAAPLSSQEAAPGAGGDQAEDTSAGGPASMPMMFNPSSMGSSAMPPNF